VNVHGSLLPKYRGAAPIVRAILGGETRTGITTMFMDPGMDTGPTLLSEETEIEEEDSAGTLHDRLSRSAPACSCAPWRVWKRIPLSRSPRTIPGHPGAENRKGGSPDPLERHGTTDLQPDPRL